MFIAIGSNEVDEGEVFEEERLGFGADPSRALDHIGDHGSEHRHPVFEPRMSFAFTTRQATKCRIIVWSTD